MRRPGGLTFQTDLATGNITEGETYRCNHCQAHTHIKPFQRPEDIGGLCRGCMQLMCPRCTAKRAAGEPCLPFIEQHEKEIERALERRRSLASYGLRS